MATPYVALTGLGFYGVIIRPKIGLCNSFADNEVQLLCGSWRNCWVKAYLLGAEAGSRPYVTDFMLVSHGRA